MHCKPTVSRTLGVALVCLLTCFSDSSRLQAAKLKPLRRIAIVPLKNLRPNTDTDWIGAGAAETLATKLAGVPDLRIVERTHLKRIIDEHDLQKADVSDTRTAVKIGKLVGAERILVGTYARSGKNILFNVRVVDVQTGVVLNTASVQAAEEKIFDALFDLANAVIKSFDKKVVVVRNHPHLIAAAKAERIELSDAQRESLKKWGTTTNSEAYRAFCRGVNDKDPDGKIRWYTTAIKLDPKYVWSYINRGTAHHDKGDVAKAIADYTWAIELGPKLFAAYYRRGLAYKEKGDHDRALADWTRVIELAPKLAKAYHNRGLAYGKKGDLAKTIADFTKAIVLDPKEAKAHKNRGLAYGKKGDLTKAIADLIRAIELDPKDAEAYYNRGLAYVRKGDYAAAIRDYTKAIALEPSRAKVYRSRAYAYRKKGDTARARADMAMYRKLGGK